MGSGRWRWFRVLLLIWLLIVALTAIFDLPGVVLLVQAVFGVLALCAGVLALFSSRR